jgi:hypothetical protein
LTLELPLWDDIAQDLGKNDNRKDQDERIDRPLSLFHETLPFLFLPMNLRPAYPRRNLRKINALQTA